KTQNMKQKEKHLVHSHKFTDKTKNLLKFVIENIISSKTVIRMLFVVVAEFFVCWAPLHVMNTWYLFSPEIVYGFVGSTGYALIHLLAYISSCCNPITYCFMNRKFRQAFLGVFDCYRCWRTACKHATRGHQMDGAALGVLGGNNNSDLSGNDSTVFVGRASTGARSEVLVLEVGHGGSFRYRITWRRSTHQHNPNYISSFAIFLSQSFRYKTNYQKCYL
ncbi:hypothetical protein L9F63_021953, partial [Diploptera punctata]